jgi:hypothetical protein
VFLGSVSPTSQSQNESSDGSYAFPKTELKGKPTLSDHSIASHIVNLFKLATRKFPASLSLWRHYIAYVLTQPSPKLVSRTLASAISLHPAIAEFWLLAARWEADGSEQGIGGGNVDGARKLLMRALRFNQTSETIWLEWLRIEVAFAERLRERWKVLGIGPSTAVENSRTEDETVVVPSLDGEENEQQPISELPDSTTGLTGQKSLIDGVLVKLVLDNAFKGAWFLRLPLTLWLTLFASNIHPLDIRIYSPLPSTPRISIAI